MDSEWGKRSLQTGTLLVKAKLLKPHLKKSLFPFTFFFLFPSSFVITFFLITNSSSLHFFSLISQPHIFLFRLNDLLLLVAPSTSLLFVVAKLYGQPVGDTAEGGWLHLPVINGVGEQADAVVEDPLHPESSWAEVIHAHLVDIVGVEVHHLQVFHIWEACGDACQPVIVQMELPQSGEVTQTAVLNVTDVVKAKSQPERSETIVGQRKIFENKTKPLQMHLQEESLGAAGVWGSVSLWCE